MHFLRWQLSRWWLLAIVPCALLLIVLLPFALIVGGHVIGGIVGPPAIWETPRRVVAAKELAGTYTEIANNVYGSSDFYVNAGALPKGIARLELRRDGTATLTNVPEDDPRTWSSPTHTLCFLSGSGTWSVETGGVGSNLNVKLQSSPAGAFNPQACTDTNEGLAEFTGQQPPFGLYLPVGDPDSGIGLRFRQLQPVR